MMLSRCPPSANFLYSFGAARKLLERAHESDSLIEGMALYVSLIDACLRIALVLDKQLAGGDEVGDIESYIQQVQGGPQVYGENDLRGGASQEPNRRCHEGRNRWAL